MKKEHDLIYIKFLNFYIFTCMCMCKKCYRKIHIKLPTLRKGISFKCYRLISFEQHFSDLQGDSSNKTSYLIKE